MGSTFFYLFACFLLLAPLYKAGVVPLPLVLLELAAIGFLFAIVVAGRACRAIPWALLTAAGLVLAYPLVQIAPLPDEVWRALPGHAEYALVLDKFAAADAAARWPAISMIPPATEYGWLTLLLPLACLLVVPRLSSQHVARLLLLMAILAGLEALLGLLQVGAGGDSIFYLRNNVAYGTATGTFVNRNHFAGMLAMTLPVIVGLLMYSKAHAKRRHRRRGQLQITEAAAQRALLFASAVLILLCLLFTRSRAGIATAFIGLAVSSIVFVRARAAAAGGAPNTYANLIVFGLAVLGIVLAMAIGLSPIIERVEPEQLRLSAEARLAIYTATTRAAVEFLPLGSGLSTFADVFPRFQLGVIGGYVDHAHNDYLQAFMEVGLVAPIVLALLLVTYVARMSELLRQESGRSFTLLQIAAGIGLLPMILHSIFDFGLHMPANAMWFATLAGVMLHPGPTRREHGDAEAA